MKQKSHEALKTAIADLHTVLPDGLLVEAGEECYERTGDTVEPLDFSRLSRRLKWARAALADLEALAAADLPRAGNEEG